MTIRLFATTCLALTGLLMLTPCGHAQPHKAKAHKPTPSHHASAGGWQPNPALLKQLGEPFSLGDYTVRPPLGYEMGLKTVEESTVILQVYRWTGEKRSDQTQPEFTILVIAPQPGYHPPSDDKVLTDIQKSIQGDLKDYVQSTLENGSIRDMDFSRAYWKGTDHDPTAHVHGFTYTAIDSRIAVLIIGEDAEPYSKDTIALAEAAAETFHRS